MDELAAADDVDEHLVVLHEVARADDDGVRRRRLDHPPDRELAPVARQQQAVEPAHQPAVQRAAAGDVHPGEDEPGARSSQAVMTVRVSSTSSASCGEMWKTTSTPSMRGQRGRVAQVADVDLDPVEGRQPGRVTDEDARHGAAAVQRREHLAAHEAGAPEDEDRGVRRTASTGFAEAAGRVTGGGWSWDTVSSSG